MEKVQYGGEIVELIPAAGVRGILCKSAVYGSYFFRVKEPDGEFTDYELRHDDLEIIISKDALAAFYCTEKRNVIDHSPEVLGLRKLIDK